MSDEKKFVTSRRSFLKGAGAFAMTAGMMPVMSLFGLTPVAADEAETKPEEAAAAAPKTAAEFTSSADEEVMKSDALFQAIITESEVKGDLTMSNGTVIPAVYVRLRNRINRIGRGIGSIPNANSYDMIMNLWSEEDAENYLKMPLHIAFTAANYAETSGYSEDEAHAILKDQASRNLIWHMCRAGLDYYALMPYINGFWEFGELERACAEGIDLSAEKIPESLIPSVAEFDSWGISGTDPNNETGSDLTFPLFRSYPVGPEVVAEDKMVPWHDWRALIKRNPVITVSPCQCRTMWQALGVPYPEEHPLNTCLSLGEMAEYFIENGIGKQITQDEAIAILEDIISKGMVVESICAKNADIICCCHSKSCGNLMGFKAIDGNCGTAQYYSAYDLKYDKEKCLKCGACVNICPMEAITMGEDGFCVMDNSCVRCGQCVRVCPAPEKPRVLTAKEYYPELPEDYIDCNRYFAKDRMRRGQLVDFTETTLDVGDGTVDGNAHSGH